MSARTATLGLLLAALLRPLTAAPSRPALAPDAGLALPGTLFGAPGSPLSLSKAEAALVARRGARILRRAYGATQVAAVTVRGGLREHHPPTACLQADGFTVLASRERKTAHGCATELTLRRGSEVRAFLYTYDDGRRAVCSYAARTIRALGQALLGRERTWSTVQILDSGPARAEAALAELMHHRRRRPE
ncbi:MAG: exosortase-associated EpsI family protein [Deltaproteobacteria bacterium]|nr:exosortase-associated EpsI family protein [Deltaproteobacteria bacterium]